MEFKPQIAVGEAIYLNSHVLCLQVCDLLVSSPCDESGFLAAQVFAVAAETGWPVERILFMPIARLTQYQHCLLRKNGVRTHWSGASAGQPALRDQLDALRLQWNRGDDSEGKTETS